MKKAIQIVAVPAACAVLIFGILTAIFGELPAAVPVIGIVAATALLLLSAFIGKRPQAFGKVWRIVCVILAIVFALVGAASMVLGYATFNGPVADYDRRVEIWGDEIPGNSTESKFDDMKINRKSRMIAATVRFGTAITGEKYSDREEDIDTYTYVRGIKGGYEKETYEDVPYLIPYIAANSDSAVIVVPGGGYGNKSSDGATYEGKDVALALNEAGISAFVLWYRSNPYEWPIPQLDMQRAVRYVRYHADDYGIDSDKISLIGFSAGGYQIGSFLNLFRGVDSFPAGYVKDDVDKTDDSVGAAAMIYPVLTYRYNVPMLFGSFDAEDVRNEKKREELLDMTDLSLHFNSAGTKQLVCYGTKDSVVCTDGAKAYINAAKTAGAQVTEIAAQGQNHGFGQKYYMDDFLEFLAT